MFVRLQNWSLFTFSRPELPAKRRKKPANARKSEEHAFGLSGRPKLRETIQNVQHAQNYQETKTPKKGRRMNLQVVAKGDPASSAP